MTRYEKGLQQLQNIDGKCGEEVITKLSNISPDLGKYIIEFAFGDIKRKRNDNTFQFAYIRWLRITITGTYTICYSCWHFLTKNNRNFFAVYTLHRFSKSIKCHFHSTTTIY